ncbi:hypothetical protein, partial [Alkalilimnicola sp. S0819]|uniref:hypothetical protein n=1 Tax=Alkalilimnicola sp. S0819 TaxID=2613922 RepID=UPI00132A5CE4
MRESSPRSHSDLEERRLIDEHSSGAPVGEAFRTLRTSLLQITQGRNFSLLVSSVCVDGGASFVARNLAASFAMDPGKTALLLYCNLL